jgi:hypothetical protein
MCADHAMERGEEQKLQRKGFSLQLCAAGDKTNANATIGKIAQKSARFEKKN